MSTHLVIVGYSYGFCLCLKISDNTYGQSKDEERWAEPHGGGETVVVKNCVFGTGPHTAHGMGRAACYSRHISVLGV